MAKTPKWATNAANKLPLARYSNVSRDFVMNSVEELLPMLVKLQLAAYRRGKKEGTKDTLKVVRVMRAKRVLP